MIIGYHHRLWWMIGIFFSHSELFIPQWNEYNNKFSWQSIIRHFRLNIDGFCTNHCYYYCWTNITLTLYHWNAHSCTGHNISNIRFQSSSSSMNKFYKDAATFIFFLFVLYRKYRYWLLLFHVSRIYYY